MEVDELGKKIARIVDETIDEIEKEKTQATDLVYINTDKNPPEVRRVNGPSLSSELWDRISDARDQESCKPDDVTVCTIANQQCTISLAQST